MQIITKEESDNPWEDPTDKQKEKIQFIMNKTNLDYHFVWSVLWWEFDLYKKEIEDFFNGKDINENN